MGWSSTGLNLKGPQGDPGADASVASATHAATGKSTPVDADELPLADSEGSFGLKKLTWANLKATVAAYIADLTEDITGAKTFTGGDVTVEAASPSVLIKNTDTAQYTGAGFSVYNTDPSFATDPAGIVVQAAIADIGGTQASGEIDAVDRNGGFLFPLLQFFLWEPLAKFLVSVDMDGNGISNLADPASAQDAMTQHYADEAYLKLDTATAKGDVYVATASGAVARQAVGSNGQVLVADSSQTNGVKYTNIPWCPEMICTSNGVSVADGYNDLPGGISVEPGINAAGVTLDAVWLRVGDLATSNSGGDLICDIYGGTKSSQGTLITSITLTNGSQDVVATLGSTYALAANAVVRAYFTKGSSTVAKPLHVQLRGRYVG